MQAFNKASVEDIKNALAALSAEEKLGVRLMCFSGSFKTLFTVEELARVKEASAGPAERIKRWSYKLSLVRGATEAKAPEQKEAITHVFAFLSLFRKTQTCWLAKAEAAKPAEEPAEQA